MQKPDTKRKDKQKNGKIKLLPSKVGKAITTLNALENKDKSCPEERKSRF